MPAPPTASDLLAELVKVPSVTPDGAAAFDILERVLLAAGFAVERPVFEGSGSEPVENLFAAIGSGEPHLTLAGHVDVVPPGPEASWRHPPFSATVDNGVLYGRGAVDMKGGLAAMVAAALRFVAHGGELQGRLSFLITADEEGTAVNGTAKLLRWATERGERFAAAIVGEPTSAEMLGDQIKIGRRGSFSATLVVEGRQGHSAYPEKADNPIRGLTQLLHALQSEPLDEGTEHFGPTSLEVVSVDVGNPAWNVIPARAEARFSSRFNDLWTHATLKEEIERRLAAAAADSGVGARTPINWSLAEEPAVSEVFLTRDDALIGVAAAAIQDITGRKPTLSTSGGTSDARFIKDYCPVIEFGPVGTTMHQIDERVPLAEIEEASRVYEAILQGFFARR